METTRLHAHFSDPELPALLRQIRASGVLNETLPSEFEVDYENRVADADWWDQEVASCRKKLVARWTGETEQRVQYHPGCILGIQTRVPKDPKWILDWLGNLNFELSSFDMLDDAWLKIDRDYSAPGFSNLHLPHGWGCAFQGNGHRHLVSRRWLEFGPWRTLRGPNDTTLVQFHDLHADPATALEQAKPGHTRMGIDESGGFIVDGHVYETGIKGFYDESERLLKIIVHGRDVPQGEMLDMCAARYHQALGPDKPLDRIAYIFMEEEPARAHLHELWLRELECWSIIEGLEVRLDESYDPQPEKPAWVQALESE